MATPVYRVQVWSMDPSDGFGPLALVAEFDNPKNIGWAKYLNDVPEAFFTLLQDDPKVSLLRTYKDNAHVLIYRNGSLRWAGMLGEWNANEDDAIFFAYGYLAGLYLLVTDFNVEYETEEIGVIVEDAFDYATGLASSISGWLTKGTIESPVTTSGGSTALEVPVYTMYWKRVLSLLREMASLGIGNTTNRVVFEITDAGVFNFWKNFGTDRGFVLRYGDGQVAGFSEQNASILHRNHILAAGQNPNDVLLREEVEDAADIATKGLRQEPVFFSFVRDSTELSRASAFRASLAVRDITDISLHFFANAFPPPGSEYVVGDRCQVAIDRGVTSISGQYLIVGALVFFMHGQERVELLFQQEGGTEGE